METFDKRRRRVLEILSALQWLCKALRESVSDSIPEAPVYVRSYPGAEFMLSEEDVS